MKALQSSETAIVYTLSGSGMIDSLPYIDTMTKKQMKKVKSLINKELKRANNDSEENQIEELIAELQEPQTPNLDKLISEAPKLKETELGKREHPIEEASAEDLVKILNNGSNQ